MCDHHFPGKVCVPDPAHVALDGTGVPVISMDANNGDVIRRDIGQVDAYRIAGLEPAFLEKVREAVGKIIQFMVGQSPTHIVECHCGRDVGCGFTEYLGIGFSRIIQPVGNVFIIVL